MKEPKPLDGLSDYEKLGKTEEFVKSKRQTTKKLLLRCAESRGVDSMRFSYVN